MGRSHWGLPRPGSAFRSAAKIADIAEMLSTDNHQTMRCGLIAVDLAGKGFRDSFADYDCHAACVNKFVLAELCLGRRGDMLDASWTNGKRR
jgi:hypothetical protein